MHSHREPPQGPSIERGRVFYLLSFTSLATEDAPLGSLNSEGILLPSPGASDSLKFFKISSYSQQEKSKECRMWIIRGAGGPLRERNRKEGPIRGSEEEGSQGQEEEISFCSDPSRGALARGAVPPERFFRTGRGATSQEVRVPGVNRRT